MPSQKYKAANGRRYLIEPVPDILTGETIGYRQAAQTAWNAPMRATPLSLPSTQPKKPQKPIWTRCRHKRKDPRRDSPVGVLL